MRAHKTSSTTILIALLCAWSFGQALVLRAADPALNVQRDPSGAKLTWNSSDGLDYVLEGSNDLNTWTQVQQSVVKEDSLHRVFVPQNQAQNFYRLVKDGVRKKAAYVGSENCKTCHQDIYTKYVESGHGYKMNPVVDGKPPTYFGSHAQNVPTPPQGMTWDDVSWVIGGALWKARFVDNNGYIVTGTNVQMNLENNTWSNYEPTTAVGTKPYDCGSCHTTGWVATTDGGVHQDGLVGFKGSFAAPGVQCEACHGPGGRHVAALGEKLEIVKDNSSAMCGQCHIRGSATTIPAKAGFIEHHEQYNEMLSAGHAGHKCVTCHDPHISTTRGMAGAIKIDCVTCHTEPKYSGDFHNEITDCTTCHMPYATKSAVALNKYTADLKTHIFKINTSATGQMFSADGKFANGSTGVTLSYVCYQCHKDSEGIGGTRSKKTLGELSARAAGFHDQ